MKKWSAGKIILLVILFFIIIIATSFAINYLIDHKENRDFYDDIKESVTNIEETPDYAAIAKMNSDTVGWIKVPNTNIDYPVVQFLDNEYYNRHGFDKKYNYRGAIYMDYRNNPTNLDSNTVIYGHNCYDKTMFSELAQYENIEFYKKTPVLQYNTLEKCYKWKIYAVFITTAKASEDNNYVFYFVYPHMDGENFDGFVSEINKRRLYVTGVDINDDDKTLVLSTCVRTLDTLNKNGKTTYRADGRIVILARALREGESEYVDTAKAYLNPNPKYPQIWYDNNNMKNPFINDENWYPKEAVKK